MLPFKACSRTLAVAGAVATMALSGAVNASVAVAGSTSGFPHYNHVFVLIE